MAIAGWLRLRGTIRPWMVAVALAGGAAGCKSTAGRDAATGPAPDVLPVVTADAAAEDAAADVGGEACAPAQVYGPAPYCVDDARCIEEHGVGWYCERGTYAIPDGCGGHIEWPTGACKPGPDASPDVGTADAGASDRPDAESDGPADRTPAELAQLVRDAVARADGRDERSSAVTVYGAPSREQLVDYGAPMPPQAPQGVVTLAGLPQQVGGTGTVDAAVVQRKLRPLQTRVRSCYETALRRDPTLGGVLQLEVGVSPAGEVTANVVTDDAGLNAAGVTECLLRLSRNVSFADVPPEGGAVRVRFGLRFAPKD